ncbi:guanylate kinase [uncultured Apibacter sp.]|uniref:guanylate kinase n=1 Tax=uncultured Apibacter sp. TaxID=1778616 RepID=UPI0025D50B64|nr:guanylate kinase [uncultured Apibacter sp.]
MGLIYQKPGNDTFQLKELLPGKNLEGKLIIFSAPSGAGKTTIVKYLLTIFPEIAFSISCTTRPKREFEVNGKDYYFLTEKEFKEKIKNNEFIEYEEVYEGRFYGTLHSEIERLWNQGKHVIFDIDVKGGLNLKKQFKERALAIFIAPPSLKDLEERLKNRNTENSDSLLARIQKADEEISFAKDFDVVIINDNLEKAQNKAKTLVKNFLEINK